MGLTKPLVILFLSFCIGACGRSALAPIVKDKLNSGVAQSVVTHPGIHIVNKGETLYSIAFKYGLNFRQVAQWNDIATPFTIYPGQRITLRPDNSGRQLKNISPSQTEEDQASRSSDSESSSVEQQSADKSATTQPINEWIWPTEGKVITSYKRSGKKGIDISGQVGQSIRAAAKGKVVYSGGGLIGYGELIIIKHNKNYLSAYGHNNKLLVKQGDFVDSGQRIATMGHSGTDEVKLHFEIRRDGKPVDPIRFLPK